MPRANPARRPYRPKEKAKAISQAWRIGLESDFSGRRVWLYVHSHEHPTQIDRRLIVFGNVFILETDADITDVNKVSDTPEVGELR